MEPTHRFNNKNHEDPSLYPKVSLTDLISLDEVDEIQRSFAEVANVTIRTIDPQGRSLTTSSNPPSLCSDAFKGNEFKDKLCGECLPTFLGGEGIIDEDFSFECIPGLKSYLVPLRVKFSKTASLILGYMVVGPVIFMKRKSREEYNKIAEGLGMDAEQLWSFALDLRVFSYHGIRSLLDMIDKMTGRILNLAYAKMMFQKRTPAPHLEKMIKTKPEQLSEFLDLFLDLAMDITHATTGSVMLLDRAKRTLEIKASCGLPQDVVKSTSVRLGEGVSGLAAEMKRPFLIRRDAADEAIADRLKKPELISSLVVPIKFRDNVRGVINVSSSKDYPIVFDEGALAILTRAAGIAGIALETIQS